MLHLMSESIHTKKIKGKIEYDIFVFGTYIDVIAITLSFAVYLRKLRKCF